jgi:hypothetical protein
MPRLRDVLRHEAGAVATIFALSTPVLVGGTLLAVDATALGHAKTQLQSIADESALAGARELHVYSKDHSAMAEGVKQRALVLLAEHGFSGADPDAEVGVDAENARVTVSVAAKPGTVLLGRLGYVSRIEARAEAHAFGSARLCVLSLGNSSGIAATRIATIDAAECAVQSNSSGADAIELDGGSRITALAICSAGGVEGPEGAFTPTAQTDCPAIDDPFADRPLAPVGPCDENDTRILLPRTIRPGHYCGGLRLGPTALVTAEPGEYVISGGPLELGPASSLVGEGVSFRFVDEDSTFTFGLGSIVSLSAPTQGPMAGFLFYQDPGIPKGRQFLIATDLATKLLGTIYLPSGVLKLDVVGLVAAQSAYTVVVADRLDVNGAHLVINSDYGATDVPVPRGVGPTAGRVALEK